MSVAACTGPCVRMPRDVRPCGTIARCRESLRCNTISGGGTYMIQRALAVLAAGAFLMSVAAPAMAQTTTTTPPAPAEKKADEKAEKKMEKADKKAEKKMEKADKKAEKKMEKAEKKADKEAASATTTDKK